ncbi:hypothetical protein BIW11_06317 [Tropilaelaps mercedesae]|uniref:Uncharacterized protein n=1 Tax=Tropilaelaps mercedesae TaxID=418985 RepID=A0A1V9XYL2_9ACAR|nr:hypothetical protein BIW11_06317 [Tropilaelaps mercedesae]
MALNDSEKATIVELLRQARFEKHAFEHSILAEYEFEVIRLHDHNRELADDLGTDTFGQLSDEGITEQARSVIRVSHRIATRQRACRSYSGTSLCKMLTKIACLMKVSICHMKTSSQ